MGSAIALGLARFSYALLLPPMKSDLGWSFAQAGAMNTANALGYLLGALAFPRLSRRWSTGTLFVGGCVATALLMAITGVLSDTGALLVQRVAIHPPLGLRLDRPDDPSELLRERDHLLFQAR